MSSLDCAADQICDVNRPGGLCQDGPCCSDPFGAFTCRQSCTQQNRAACPPAQPYCKLIKLTTEDYIESFYVCMP
jgi:hypothetical protein